MNTSRLIAVLLAALAAAPALRAEAATLGKDVNFRVKLSSGLSSTLNKRGDTIAAIVVEPEQFKGATLEGQVDEAKSSGKVNKRSTLRFAFSAMILPAGESIPISSTIRSYRNSKGKEGADEEGNLIEKTNNVAATAAITAVGAGLGAIFGGVKGTAIGAGTGLLGALVFVSFGTKAPSITFAPGSEIEMLVSDRRPH